jgi:hypothetical protein
LKKALLRYEAYLRVIYADLGMIPTIFIFSDISRIFNDYGVDGPSAWLLLAVFAITTIHF